MHPSGILSLELLAGTQLARAVLRSELPRIEDCPAGASEILLVARDDRKAMFESRGGDQVRGYRLAARAYFACVWLDMSARNTGHTDVMLSLFLRTRASHRRRERDRERHISGDAACLPARHRYRQIECQPSGAAESGAKINRVLNRVGNDRG